MEDNTVLSALLDNTELISALTELLTNKLELLGGRCRDHKTAMLQQAQMDL